MNIRGGERGASMLFVLASLIVTGFLGIALLKLSGSDTTTNVFYKGSAAARSAAKSGIIAALNEIQTQDPTKRDAMIARLQRWIDTENSANIAQADRWIVGSATAFEPLSANMEYRVEMLAFDTSNFTVTLKSEGQKTGGGKAKLTGTYRLDGIEFDKDDIDLPTSALYMGGGGDEFNRAMHIHGKTYLKSNAQCLDNQGQQFEFHGDFYLDNVLPDNADETDYFVLKSATFFERACFNGHVVIDRHGGSGTPGNQTIFKKGVGVATKMLIRQEAEFVVESEGLYVDGAIEMNGTVGFTHPQTGHTTEGIDFVNGGEYKYNDTKRSFYGKDNVEVDDSLNRMFNGYTTLSPVSEVNVEAELQVYKPPKVSVKMDAVIAKAKPIGRGYGEFLPSITKGEDLNSIYENYNSNDFFVDDNNEKWMVLKLHNNCNDLSFSTEGVPFKYKVIWIIDKKVTFNTVFYNHEKDGVRKGNSLIYVTGTGSMDYFKSPPVFRGFIFSESAKSDGVTVQAKSGSVLHGGVYLQDNLGDFRVEGAAEQNSDGSFVYDASNNLVYLPGVFTVRFDQTVIDELEPLGIFINENSTNQQDLVLKANHAHISTSMLSSLM